MASNKTWIEKLEVGLGGLQDSMSRLEVGIANKLRLIEENLLRLSDTIMSSREGSISHSLGWLGPIRLNKRKEDE